MKKQILFLIITLSYSTLVLSQVKIGGTGAPHINSVLELDGGTDKGLLLPRLTNGQMIEMSTAPNGMIIFNMTDQAMYCRKNETWEKMENGPGGGITLPHASTHNLTDDYILDLTHSGNGGAAILGIATDSAGGVYGYSENGIATLGNSINGMGGYFSSVNGLGLFVDGEIGIGNPDAHAPLTLPDSMGKKIYLYGSASGQYGLGVQPGVFQLYADQSSSSIAFGTGDSNDFEEKMRISGSGKVGIGTQNPQSPLSFPDTDGNKISFKGDSISNFGIGINNTTLQFYSDKVSSDIAFGYGNSSGFVEKMRIKGSGNVGIGNGLPFAPLTFRNAVGSKIALSGSELTNHYGIGIQNNLMQFYSNQASSDIAFGHGNSNFFFEKMRIKGDGRVGIGTTSPNASALLDLNSTNKGMLLPRMTSFQRESIVSPAFGLAVFDTDHGLPFFFTNGGWKAMMLADETKIPPVDIVANNAFLTEKFGAAVDVSGNYAIIGAPHEKDSITQTVGSGAAYIFFRSEGDWIQQAKIPAPEPEFYSRFGFSVSISGDYAIVGCPFQNVNGGFDQGKCFIYHRSGQTWALDTTLIDLDGMNNDHYGYAVDIRGNQIIVGIPDDQINDQTTGSAYIYWNSGNGWIERPKIHAASYGGGNFGYSVAIDGNRAVIGSPSNTNAYVFKDFGAVWLEEQLLEANYTKFGTAVEIDGYTIAIGAPGFAGSAFIYDYNNAVWDLTIQFQSAVSPLTGDEFGNSIALDGDKLVVGKDLDDINGAVDMGSAEVYAKINGTWQIERVIKDPDGNEGDMAGSAVALDDNHLLVGCPVSHFGKGKVLFYYEE